MYSIILKLRNQHPKLLEIIRFLIVGTLATLIDMLVMAVFIYVFNKNSYNSFFDVFLNSGNGASWSVVVTTAIGFLVGLVVNYFLSLFYVYQGQNNFAKTKRGFLVFGVLSAIGLGIQTLGMYIGNSLLSINEWIVKIFLVVVVLMFNYITRKIFVFKNVDVQNSQKLNSEGQVKDENNVKKDYKSSIKTILLNIAFILSSIGLFLLLYRSVALDRIKSALILAFYIILITVSLCFGMFVLFKEEISKIKFQNKFILFASVPYALVAVFGLAYFSPINLWQKIVLGIVASFAIYIYSYLFLNFLFCRIKKFWNELTKYYKILFICLFLFGVGLSVILSFKTIAFSLGGASCDVLFSFDTGYQVMNKTHFNIWAGENDARHFLLSLCSLPFAVPAFAFFYIFKSTIIYGLVLSIIQVAMTVYCAFIIIKFLKIENKIVATLVLFLLILSASFLFNMLIVEKFVLATFYILTTLKLSQENNDAKWIALLGAVGTLSTSIILLPIVVFYNKKSINEAISEIINFIVVFFIVMLLFGQLNLLIYSYSYDSIFAFSGSGRSDVGFTNKILQCLSFVASIFICPKYFVNNKGHVHQVPVSFNIYPVIGGVVLLIVVVSAIINWKNKFARICSIWNAFMLFLLAVLGWGAVLDEMFIYSFIFGWSIISMLILFFKKLIKNDKIKIMVLLVSTILIVLYNFVDLISITNLISATYPCFYF